MTTISVILLCVCAALLIFAAVFLIISPRRARAAGVIGSVFPSHIPSFVILAVLVALDLFLVFSYASDAMEYKALLEDGRERGAAAFLEYVGRDSHSYKNDDIYVAASVDYYTKRMERAENLAWLYAAGALAYGLALTMSRVYITKEGLFFIGNLKPKKTTAEVEKGKIRFYPDDDTRAVLKLPATEENLRLYSDFIVSETAELPKPELPGQI